jgi:phage gp36-like protein
MGYLSAYADLKGLIPLDFVVQALDDDGDGEADSGLFDSILEDTEREINGFCAQRYATPFSDPVPDLILDAAKILVGLRLYIRRGRSGDANPLTAEAKRIRTKLQAVADGTEPLEADRKPANAQAVAITEDSRIFSSEGNNMV